MFGATRDAVVERSAKQADKRGQRLGAARKAGSFEGTLPRPFCLPAIEPENCPRFAQSSRPANSQLAGFNATSVKPAAEINPGRFASKIGPRSAPGRGTSAVPRQATLAPRPARAGGKRLRGTASLLLLVLGLFFWIPALLRAKVGASAATERSANAAELRTSFAAAAAAQVADASAPTPSLLPTAANRMEPSGHSAAIAPMARLVLTTTILGQTRRAAMVNGRLYREGDKIAAGPELYRLAGVAEDHIELVSLGRPTGGKRSVRLQSVSETECDPQGSH
jgi:hypothetical protein